MRGSGGKGGKRGGEAGGSEGKRGRRVGSGEEGGKQGKTGKGNCAIFSSKADFEPLCPLLAVYCHFVSVLLFLDRLEMVFSNLAFRPSKTVFFGSQLGLTFLSSINVI